MKENMVFTPFEVIHDQKGKGTAMGYYERNGFTYIRIRFSDDKLQDFVFPDQFLFHLKASEPKTQSQIEKIFVDLRSGERNYDLDFQKGGQVNLKQGEKNKLIKNRFEQYMILNGYSRKSLSGNLSTVSSYIYSVERVCKREECTWEMLASRIGIIVHKYDIGGAEEDFGNSSKRTVINALKCFQRFVEHFDTMKSEKTGERKTADFEPDEPTLIELLGKDLKQMYENAPENEKDSMPLLFGIMYENEIDDLAFTYDQNTAEIVTEIIRASGIHSSYQAEVSKGVRLSKYVSVKRDVILPN